MTTNIKRRKKSFRIVQSLVKNKKKDGMKTKTHILFVFVGKTKVFIRSNGTDAFYVMFGILNPKNPLSPSVVIVTLFYSRKCQLYDITMIVGNIEWFLNVYLCSDNASLVRHSLCGFGPVTYGVLRPKTSYFLIRRLLYYSGSSSGLPEKTVFFLLLYFCFLFFFFCLRSKHPFHPVPTAHTHTHTYVWHTSLSRDISTPSTYKIQIIFDSTST